MVPTVSPDAFKAHVLLVDDEINTSQAIKRAFELTGYSAQIAANGEEALAWLEKTHFDVMLLDLRMPGVNGLQVMRAVQEKYPDLIIIVLTAHASLDSAISAVKAGAADYLLKPQKIADIEAAVEKALNRRQAQDQRRRLIGGMAETLQSLQTDSDLQQLPTDLMNTPEGTVTLDTERRRFTIHSSATTVELTAAESALLAFMMQHPDHIFSSRELAIQALGYQNLSEIEAKKIIRPHITRLRRKIEADPNHPTFIHTLRSKGYIFQI